MAKAPKMCFDKILPGNLNRPHRMRQIGSGPMRAVAPIGKIWLNRTKLTISFIGGTKSQRDAVKKHAPEWTEYADLEFEFNDDPNATIRISFDPELGAWSYIGTDNKNIRPPQATMNLGWVDRAVILHEFGHMIGLGHEHQNPDGGILWNEQVVIDNLSQPPNEWSEATTRFNVLDKYSRDNIHGTEFDPDSIMLYFFDGSWTLNRPQGTKANLVLSETDKKFIASSVMYPGAKTTPEEIIEIPVFDATHGSISSHGEEDMFTFTITEMKPYIIETNGGTDLYLSLFGPDDRSELITQDDDSGLGRNPRVEVVLSPGTYYAQVRHFDALQLGDYTIQVMARG